MKILKSLGILSLFAILFITSCNQDDEILDANNNNASKSISEIISERVDLSTLSQALIQTRTDSVLRTTTTYTVFAPNDNAFSALDLSPLSDEELQNVVLNHALSTVTADFSSTFSTGYIKTLANGPDNTNINLYVNTEGDSFLNGNSSLVDNAYDIGATNGIVHVINNVLIPPTVLDQAKANPNYSILAEAIELAGLDEALSITDTTNDNYPYTLFAPNNIAFEDLLMQLNGVYGWQTLNDVPVAVLQEVLLYHVISGVNGLAADVDGTTLTSMQEETFSIDGTLIDDASYTNTTITLTDVQSLNGVMHGIDKVLLPDSIFQGILDQTLNLLERCNDKGYTKFAQAINMAGLTEAVSSDSYTLFAPNDSAFDLFFLTIENFDSLSDFDTQEDLLLLENLVRYHITQSQIMASDLTEGLSVTTEQGDTFTYDATNATFVPSFEYATASNVVNSNIGASNGIIHEINTVLVSETDAQALGYPLPANGNPVYGYEIYDDALNPVFWIGGWTSPDFASTDQVRSGVYSIRVDYAGDDGFQIGGANADLTQFNTVNASFYSENGTSVTFILNEQWGSGQTVNIPAGEWTDISLPITSISNGTTILDQFVIRDASLIPNTLYIDQVGLDVIFESAIPIFNYEIYTENNINAPWIGGWSAPVFDSTTNPSTGIFSAEVLLDANAGFQLGGTNIDLSTYSVVKFSIYSETSTQFKLVLNEQWDGYILNVTPGEWTDFTVPLADVLYGTTTYTQFVIQDLGGAQTNLFVDDIGFD